MSHFTDEDRWLLRTVHMNVLRLRQEVAGLTALEEEQMSKSAEVLAAVTDMTSVVDGAVTVFTDLEAKLQAALDVGDPAQMQAAIDELKADKEKLAAAIAANTPAAPAPAAAPPADAPQS